MRKCWINAEDPDLGINKQLELACLSKASYYYQPVAESALNLELMDLIDKLYTECPFYGSRRLLAEIRRKGFDVNRKRIVRLMNEMGLQAIFPNRHLTKTREDHVKYPYLLKDLSIDRPNQVWATDITYIRVGGGYLYLTAVMDWYTRFVLSWRLSNTLDVTFCVEALEAALESGTPEIFNSDQGCQYTSKLFTEALTGRDIRISMSGKGRCYDNILVERLWRSLKYEEVYVKRYESGIEAHQGLANWFQFYNSRRPHQSLDYCTPESAFLRKVG